MSATSADTATTRSTCSTTTSSCSCSAHRRWSDGGPYPLALNIARFGAPAVTVYALVEAGRLLFATELRRLRARNARGHVVVCGDTLVAGTLTRRLRAAGDRVVVGAAPTRWPAAAARRGCPGDARDPDVLRAAGVGRARALYACTDDSAANTAIALAAARPRHGRPPLAVYAQVADPELCLGAAGPADLGPPAHPASGWTSSTSTTWPPAS